MVEIDDDFRVRAAVSSTDYFDTARAGAIDYLQLPRSSSSTFKPLLFAQALESRTIDPSTILDDLEPGPGGILNSNERFLGPMLPRVALANSRNVPAVALLSRIGLDTSTACSATCGCITMSNRRGATGSAWRSARCPSPSKTWCAPTPRWPATAV